MKKTIILLFVLSAFSLLFTSTALGTVTQSSNSITDGKTNVSTEVGSFSIQLNSTEGAGSIYCNLSLYQGTTMVTYSYVSAQSNNSQLLIIPSLDGNTLYQVRINANDTDGYNNKTYNFTTGNKKLTDDTDNFGTSEILLLGLIVIVIVIAFIASLASDIKNKSINVEKLIKKVILIIMFTVIIIIIASLI